MKMISLNAWCGIKYDNLINFLQKYSEDVDVFCFQEIRNGKYLNEENESSEVADLLSNMINVLPDFNPYFSEMVPGVGLASFVRKNISVESVEVTEILRADEIKMKMSNGNSYYPRIMQSIHLKEQSLIIHNFHGIPGNAKKDSPEREVQINRLLNVFDKDDKSHIIVGDFNLDINTEAISKLEERLKNLIKEYNIKTTRNSNYNQLKELPFADYAFVSESLPIKNFTVLPEEVSDHMALFLEIN